MNSGRFKDAESLAPDETSSLAVNETPLWRCLGSVGSVRGGGYEADAGDK